MALSKTTQNHEEIRSWAEKRGAVPAEVSSTHRDKEPGILRFCFPKATNKNNDSLREISWGDFFEKFDDNNLEMVYQEKTATGRKSNFNKLVHPEAKRRSSSRSSSSSRSTSSRTHSSKSHRRAA